jgi:branched-chain amino acid transport system substrate-binding protein
MKTRSRARAIRLAAVTAAVAAVTAACSSTGETTSSAALGQASGPPIRVGISLSLTGDFQADGLACRQGYELWASDVNSHGGLLGRPVKLIILNDNSDPKTATAAYEKLVKQYHVDLLLGPFSSLLTVPAGAVAKEHNYAFVEGSGGAPVVYESQNPNLFGVSAPVESQLVPFADWVASLPPGKRPASAAYPMVDDPFADPPVLKAQAILARAGVKTVYSAKPYTKISASALAADARAVAASNAEIVVLGSVDPGTVGVFVHEFERVHYQPKVFIAAAGPDQGQAFLNAVGTGNATGILVPDSWYGGYENALSHVMVQDYIAKYGGTVSDINADVAEAYSAGQVMAAAVNSTKGLNQDSIMRYLHSGVTLQTVQGPASFGAFGINTKAVSFIFQWQPGARFVQVLGPQGPSTPGSLPIIATKPPWTG